MSVPPRRSLPALAFRGVGGNGHPYELQLMMRFWRTLGADPTLAEAERLPTLESVDALLRERAAAVHPA